MKLLVIGLCITVMTMASLANTTQSHTKITEWSARTATKKGLAIVPSMMRIPKPKIFRSNPFRQAYFNSHWDDNDDIDIDDDDKLTGPRREQFGRIKSNPTPQDPEGDITPDIEWRLFLARTAAMLKYRSLHS